MIGRFFGNSISSMSRIGSQSTFRRKRNEGIVRLLRKIGPRATLASSRIILSFLVQLRTKIVLISDPKMELFLLSKNWIRFHTERPSYFHFTAQTSTVCRRNISSFYFKKEKALQQKFNLEQIKLSSCSVPVSFL